MVSEVRRQTMKWLYATVLLSAVAVGSVSAQQPATQPPTGSQPATQTGAQGTEKQTPATPATKKPAATRASMPSGDQNLGSVHITRKVMANGEPLAPGTYQVRLTQDEATPPATGTDPKLERWAEFVQGSKVKGKEVVSVVPQGEIAQVANSKPPRPGSSRVELLKGEEYVRVWINKGGTNYLIHLATGQSEKAAPSKAK
jgi:hypothetical protein